MNLQHRIDLMSRLGQYILINPDTWQTAKEKAYYSNGWFIPSFIDLAADNIATRFLQKDILQQWAASYDIPATTESKTVGVVMAGNIPLVGFHDLLCVFISGHKAMVKTSSKDEVLIKHLVETLIQWEPGVAQFITFSEMLKGCDAYIATGSNNTAGYFDYYFNRFPHIIRRNRTSVAVLTGKETSGELQQLADDVYSYFGLGCRNVTKIYVPGEYDFVPLLDAFRKYEHLADHHKYKNNYDYNLAVHILNNKFYMSNSSLILAEGKSVFSPISQLNYEFYSDADKLAVELENNNELQCIVGNGFVPFGKGQSPSVSDYADGVDTMAFLHSL
jgi:hypothetical protein